MDRKLNAKLIDKFLNEDLWKNHLRNDCMKGEVFLAIRKNRIDLYHKGGKLFSYNSRGFKTHIKYAAAIHSEKDYLTEDELEDCTLETKFTEKYSRIKENCSNYSGVEASGLATFYQKNSYLTDNNVVVLDIEVSLKSDDEDRTQDRIDLVLYNRKERTLRFVEAKHFSNSAIWAKGEPKVIGQIKRYEQQITQKENDIISGYKDHITALKSIFESSGSILLDEHVEIEKKVPLLIFGFDRDQKTGRLKELVTENVQYEGINVIPIGKVESINQNNIWSNLK